MFLVSALLFCSLFAVGTSIQTQGPCTFGTHPSSGGLKCTENGYFELVQCPTNQAYCVCLDPSTGHESARTRTSSNKLTPLCGGCHVLTARILSNFSGLRLPQCEGNTGVFQRKQCLNDQKCWCVDQETGQKKAKEGVSTETPNSQLNCEKSINSSAPEVQFSLDSGAKSTVVQEKTALGVRPEEPPVASPICRLPKDNGKACTNSSARVQWYFDMASFECLAFRHQGCQGNENRFDSISECWHACKLADMGGCAGMLPAAKNDKGDNLICTPSSSQPVAKCPTGYRCQMMAFFGICCHIETQELYTRNYRPTCANGKTAQKVTSGGIPMTLIGKSCDDQFCPENMTCIKQEVFAHCCPK